MSDLGQRQRMLRVKGHNRWYSRKQQCPCKAVVERDGGCFCKQHDPENIEQRRKDQRDAWRAQAKAERAANERREAEAAACAGVDHLTPGMVKEMLEALREIGKCWGSGPDNANWREIAAHLGEKARAAIAKAEGQG